MSNSEVASRPDFRREEVWCNAVAAELLTFMERQFERMTSSLSVLHNSSRDQKDAWVALDTSSHMSAEFNELQDHRKIPVLRIGDWKERLHPIRFARSRILIFPMSRTRRGITTISFARCSTRGSRRHQLAHRRQRLNQSQRDRCRRIPFHSLYGAGGRRWVRPVLIGGVDTIQAKCRVGSIDR